MRKPVLVLAVLLLTGAAASAQTTPAPKTTTPDDNAKLLDGYLAAWEKAMRGVKTLSAQLNRVDKDKVLTNTSTYTGFAYYMKSGDGPSALNLASLELKPKDKKEFSEKIVCTGTYLYVFVPAQKEIRAYELPKPKGNQVADDGFLGLLFGMRAEDAKKKYTLTLEKVDKYYVYVWVAPKDAKDKAEFARARLVLNKDTYLPAQLWFEHSNGNEVTWSIPKAQTGVTLDRRAFDKPALPDGWKLVPVTEGKKSNAPAPQPRVIRQANQ